MLLSNILIYSIILCSGGVQLQNPGWGSWWQGQNWTTMCLSFHLQGKYQGWEFAHLLIAHSLICSFAHFTQIKWATVSDWLRSLIAHSLICSFAHFTQIKWATVSDWLRSLKTNEWSWANCSGRSAEMSDHERFAQVTQRNWANERFAQKMLAKKN